MNSHFTKKELQKQKLAEALRENLKKRKNQQRLRDSIEQESINKGDEHAHTK